MAAKASCKCKKVECEECPEWIFTFADLVMLMMGFFVILWVLKPDRREKGDTAKRSDYVVKIAAAIRGGFGYVPNPQSRDPVDMQMIVDGLRRFIRPAKAKRAIPTMSPRAPWAANRR